MTATFPSTSSFSHVWRPVVVAVALGLTVSACGTAVPVGGDTSPVGSIHPARSQFTSTHPNDFSVHGIDVSKYQGDIDWQSVRASGITFAYIKATEGADRVDSKFYQNWQNAKAAGVKRGAYHFAFWCRKPEEEMRNFLNTVPNDPDALPPVLDVEATPKSGSCKKTLYPEETIAQMRRMLEMMERHYGKRPVIYSTVDFYEAILHPSALEEYPIWVRSTKYSPHVHYGARKWHFWQFQSDARIAGIKGNVDRNAFHGDYRQFAAFAAGDKAGTALGYAGPAQSIAPPLPPSRPAQDVASQALQAIPGGPKPMPMTLDAKAPALRGTTSVQATPSSEVVPPVDVDE